MNTVFQEMAKIAEDFDSMRVSIAKNIEHLYETAYVLDKLGECFDSDAKTKLNVKLRAGFTVKAIVNGVEKSEHIELEHEYADTFSTYYGYNKSEQFEPNPYQKLSLNMDSNSFKKLMESEFTLVKDSTSWDFQAEIENLDGENDDDTVFFLCEIAFYNKSSHEMAEILQDMTTAHYTHFALSYGQGYEYTLPKAKDFINENPEHSHWDAETIAIWDKDPSEIQEP